MHLFQFPGGGGGLLSQRSTSGLPTSHASLTFARLLALFRVYTSLVEWLEGLLDDVAVHEYASCNNNVFTFVITQIQDDTATIYILTMYSQHARPFICGVRNRMHNENYSKCLKRSTFYLQRYHGVQQYTICSDGPQDIMATI